VSVQYAPRTVPIAVVAAVSADIGEDIETGKALFASLAREGVAGATRRFPHIPQRDILRVATALVEREITVVHDTFTRVFHAGGLRWRVVDPEGLDNFTVQVASRDSTRMQLHVAFSVSDVAVGRGLVTTPDSQLVGVLAKEPQLRMNISRHIRGIAVSYLGAALRKSNDIPHPIQTHVTPLARGILSMTRIYPYINLRPRIMPDSDAEGTRHVSVDVTFAMVVEISSPSRSEGRTFYGVEIEDSGAMFAVSASAAEDLEQAAGKLQERGDARAAEIIDNAHRIRQAIAPQRRRKREREVLDKGPPDATRVEVIKVGDDEDTHGETPRALDIIITEEGHPMLRKVAGIQGQVDAAAKWWTKHRGLVKPPIRETVSDLIAKFGREPNKRDIPLLVDMAFPTLGKIAKKRSPQFENEEFGVDAATAGLAKLVQAELQRRVR